MKKFENLYFTKASIHLALQFLCFFVVMYRKTGRLIDAPKLRLEFRFYQSTGGTESSRPFAGTGHSSLWVCENRFYNDKMTAVMELRIVLQVCFISLFHLHTFGFFSKVLDNIRKKAIKIFLWTRSRTHLECVPERVRNTNRTLGSFWAVLYV